MCLRETHEENEHERVESLVGLEGNERKGYWVLGVETEARQVSAIVSGFRNPVVAEDMVGEGEREVKRVRDRREEEGERIRNERRVGFGFT